MVVVSYFDAFIFKYLKLCSQAVLGRIHFRFNDINVQINFTVLQQAQRRFSVSVKSEVLVRVSAEITAVWTLFLEHVDFALCRLIPGLAATEWRADACVYKTCCFEYFQPASLHGDADGHKAS